MAEIDFSVVVPVYNGQGTVVRLYEWLDEVFTEMGRTFEVIYVNDASPDDSFRVLKEIHSAHDNVKVIDLYRNFGQQNALMCGFQFCTGKYVVTMDDDLQNPPSEIPALVAKIEEGYDAVFGSYRIKKHAAYKNLGSLAIRKLNQIIFKPGKALRMSSFRVVRREVIDEIKGQRTPFPYISGMLLSTTTNIVNVEVAHHPRKIGQSSYTLGKLISLSYNLLINYSALPLKFMGYLGLLVSLLSFLFSTTVIVRKLILGQVPPGWTSIVVLLSFFFGLLYLMMFVLGEYVSRILRELSSARQYTIKEKLE